MNTLGVNVPYADCIFPPTLTAPVFGAVFLWTAADLRGDWLARDGFPLRIRIRFRTFVVTQTKLRPPAKVGFIN